MGLLSAMCKEWLSFPLPLLKIIQGRRPICKGHGLLSFQKSFSLPDFFVFLSIRRESASKVQVLRGVRRGRCAGSRIIRAVIPQFPQPLLKTLLKVWKNRFSRGFFHHLHRVFHNRWKTFPHNSLDNPLCQDGNLPIFARFPPLFLAKFPSFSAGAPCGRQRSPPCAKSSSDPGENGCHLPTGPV